MEMTHLSLFTGIGGLDLAAEWAGFKTVGQCELHYDIKGNTTYPWKILNKHWPNVPKFGDIRTLTGDKFYERTGLRTVTVLSGGFPCQPFSVAGKQKGKADDRFLWPEMFRVIRELHPAYIVGENVPGILHIAADDVCADLEREGYEVGIFDYEAAAVGAQHRRERFFFVGRSKHNGQSTEPELRGNETSSNQRRPEELYEAGKSEGTDRPVDVSGIQGCESGSEQSINPTVAYSDIGKSRSGNEPEPRKSAYFEFSANGSNESRDVADAESTEQSRERREAWRRRGEFRCSGRWSTEPDVGRVANGVPSRVDRLKCLGNAVVPQQAYPIFKSIYDIESSLMEVR